MSFLTDWNVWRRERDAEIAAVYGSRCDAYPPDPRWVVPASYECYAEPRWDTVDAADGHQRRVPVHGVLRFVLHGVECALEPYSSGPPGLLNVAFRDATGGSTTFGPARVIFPPVPPVGAAEVVLDFNRAINPPCAFTPYAACALPPAGNTLPIAVEAGEKLPPSP